MRVQVVKVRGENMAAAAKLGKPHGMLSIIGLDDAKLEALCAQARASQGAGSVCQLANYLFPQGRVVSGHKDALEEVRACALAGSQVVERCDDVLSRTGSEQASRASVSAFVVLLQLHQECSPRSAGSVCPS